MNIVKTASIKEIEYISTCIENIKAYMSNGTGTVNNRAKSNNNWSLLDYLSYVPKRNTFNIYGIIVTLEGELTSYAEIECNEEGLIASIKTRDTKYFAKSKEGKCTIPLIATTEGLKLLPEKERADLEFNYKFLKNRGLKI